MPKKPLLAGMRSHFPNVSYRGWQAGLSVFVRPTGWLELGTAAHATAVRGPGTCSSFEPGPMLPLAAEFLANFHFGRQLITISAGADRLVAEGVESLVLSVQLGFGVQI